MPFVSKSPNTESLPRPDYNNCSERVPESNSSLLHQTGNSQTVLKVTSLHLPKMSGCGDQNDSYNETSYGNDFRSFTDNFKVELGTGRESKLLGNAQAICCINHFII